MKQSMKFRIISALAQFLFNIRQEDGALGKLQTYFDGLAGRYYNEDIYWLNHEKEQSEEGLEEKKPETVKAVYCKETNDWLFV